MKFGVGARYGDYVIAGTHSDEVCAEYKRPPVMTQKERVDWIMSTGLVDKVIPDCPLNLTDEFMRQHNIHHVVCSAEYDSDDDEYYEVARKAGKLTVAPRTEGISSSEIIRRIKAM